ASSGLDIGVQAQVLGQPLTLGAAPPPNAIPVGARSSGLLGVLGPTSVEVYGSPLGQPLDVGVGAGLPDAGDNVVGQLLGRVQVTAIVAGLPVPGLAGTLAAQVASVLGVVRQVATVVTTDQLGLTAVLKTVNMHLSELLTPVRSTVSVVLGGLRVSDLVEGV